MVTNGANNKNVAVRDERGRWLKGFSGGPGRPLGSRNKLSEDFLGDIHAAWLSHGQKVLDRIIAEQPEVFFLAMVSSLRRSTASNLVSPAPLTGRANAKRYCSSWKSALGQRGGRCSRISWSKWRSWRPTRRLAWPNTIAQISPGIRYPTCPRPSYDCRRIRPQMSEALLRLV